MYKHNPTIAGLLLAGTLTSMTSLAQAAQPGPYFGAGFGATEDHILSESDAGTKFFAGINITPNIGLEVSFIDLGEYANDTITQEGTAYELVGYLPVASHMDIYGKFGLFDWEVSNGFTTNTGDDVTYGFGVSVRMSNNLSLRGEWQTFADVDGGDVDMLSANISLNF